MQAGARLLRRQGGAVCRAVPRRRRAGARRLRGRDQSSLERDAAREDGHQLFRLARLHRGAARRPLGEGEPDLQFDAVQPLRRSRRSTSTASSDALLQAYDGDGRTFMRYEVMHGAFHDVPVKFLIAEMARLLSAA